MALQLIKSSYFVLKVLFSRPRRSFASIEDSELLEAVYEYIISLKYPVSCSENRKRAIRRKAKKFQVKDGVLYYIQRRRGKVR